MMSVHSLPSSALVGRIFLVWFMLTLGAAVGFPIVAPKAMEVVCSTQGVVKLIAVDTDEDLLAHRTLECPECLAQMLLACVEPSKLGETTPFAYVLQKAYVTHISTLLGPPLPARGPPHAS